MTLIADYTETKVIDGSENNLMTIKNSDEFFGKITKALVSNNKAVISAKGKIKENKNTGFTLSDKSCIIRIGGTNKVEQEEDFRRIEDAVSSLGSAIKEGIVLGGGITYINAYDSLIVSDFPSYLEKVMGIVYRTVVYNICGKDTTADNVEYYGLFPGRNMEFQNLDESIFDSAEVVKEVIRNSFSLVAQIITTSKIIHEMVR